MPVSSSTDLVVIPEGAIKLNDEPLGELTLGAGEELSPQQVANWLNAGIDAHPFFSSEQSMLVSDIASSADTLELKNADLFSDLGGVIQIGDEQIYYSGKTTNTEGKNTVLTGLVRGFNGTVVDSHVASAAVKANDLKYAEVFNEIRIPSASLYF